jgi:hypothetical protein
MQRAFSVLVNNLKTIRSSVMAGLVPAIHVFLRGFGLKTWMPGTSPGMTAGFQKIMLKQRDEIVTRSNLIAT